MDELIRLEQEKLHDLHRRLINILQQVGDAGVNFRPNEQSNSIANLMIHLVGNLRQRFVAGLGASVDDRDREQEFRSREVYTHTELIEMIDAIFAIIHDYMMRVNPEMIYTVYQIQGLEMSALEVIFGVVTHVSEHVGQAIYIAKMQLGSEFKALWKPRTQLLTPSTEVTSAQSVQGRGL